MSFIAVATSARHSLIATPGGRVRVERGMQQLIFVCPATGRKVDTGIETDLDTLVRISEQHVHGHCPACGQWHEWPVRDALPAKAA